jgi:hypothetical protein
VKSALVVVVGLAAGLLVVPVTPVEEPVEPAFGCSARDLSTPVAGLPVVWVLSEVVLPEAPGAVLLPAAPVVPGVPVEPLAAPEPAPAPAPAPLANALPTIASTTKTARTLVNFFMFGISSLWNCRT